MGDRAVGLEEPWQAPDGALLLLCADAGLRVRRSPRFRRKSVFAEQVQKRRIAFAAELATDVRLCRAVAALAADQGRPAEG